MKIYNEEQLGELLLKKIREQKQYMVRTLDGYQLINCSNLTLYHSLAVEITIIQEEIGRRNKIAQVNR